MEIFLKEAPKVVAIDVNADAPAKLAADMKTAGHTIEIIQADLSQPEQMQIGERRGIAAGGIDVMWAHAGIPGPSGIENLDLDAYQAAMTLNITSAALAAGEVIGHMRERGGGSLILTSSVSGLVVRCSARFIRRRSLPWLASLNRGRNALLRWRSRQCRLSGTCGYTNEDRLH